jgi:hypothetical protein
MAQVNVGSAYVSYDSIYDAFEKCSILWRH